MELNAVFFLIAIPAVIFAGISKGGFGSGAAFAAATFLALVVPPDQALGVMLPLLMVMDVSALRPYWRQWDGRATLLLIAGSLPGVALGAWMFTWADADLFRLMIGVISLAFVAFQLARQNGWLRLEKMPSGTPAGLFWGGIAGLTSMVSHAGGPPAAVYLLSKGVSKSTYQATTVFVFWAINVFKFVPYAALGVFSQQSFMANLYLAPAAVFGVWAGVRLHRIIPERAFFQLTYLLLTVTGTRLIWVAVT